MKINTVITKQDAADIKLICQHQQVLWKIEDDLRAAAAEKCNIKQGDLVEVADGTKYLIRNVRVVDRHYPRIKISGYKLYGVKTLRLGRSTHHVPSNSIVKVTAKGQFPVISKFR